MNKGLLIVGIISLGVLLPVTALTGKNSANVTATHSRNAVTLPVVQDTVTSTTQVPIKELDTKGATLIQFNTEVTEATVNSAIKAIKKANRRGTQAIYLLIDSPGGSVFDGARLITAMEASKAPVYTVCTELCASMAAHILEHGVQRYMIDRTQLMFHPASTSLMQEGEVDKIYSRLGSSKRFIDKLDMYDATRSGQNFAEFKAKSMREYWTDAEDALSDHLIDGIVSIEFEKETPPISIFGNQLKSELKQLTSE